MASGVFVVALVLLITLFKRQGLRLAFVHSSIIMGGYIYLSTEILSAFSKLDFWHVLASWILLCLILIYVVRHDHVTFLGTWSEIIKKFKAAIRKLSLLEITILIAVVVIVSAIFVTAVKSPPNNYDSMTYHLPRVEHWIQNKSINFYPTNIERQLYMSPFAEITILQVRLLSGNDRLVNLVQWFSMVGSLIVISLIARELGLKAWGQLIAVVFAATIPMGILEASSTQNDYVGSFWVCSSILLLLKAKQDNLTLKDIFFVGCSLGLALLTKQTSLLLLIPFIFCFSVKTLKKNFKASYAVASIFLIIFLFNVSHYGRNYLVFKNPLGPEPEKYSIGILGPKYLVSNMAKNLSLHLGTLNAKNNAAWEKVLADLHNWLRVDIGDSRTSWEGQKFQIYPLSLSENYAGNPGQLLIITLATFLILLNKKLPKKTRVYVVAVWLGFLILLTYLRWQPWSSRFHLPFFVIMSPIVAVVLAKFPKIIVFGVIALLIYNSYPYVFKNLSSPLIGEDSIFSKSRDEIIFSDAPKTIGVYNEIVDTITKNNFRNIGVCTVDNVREYPLWTKLREKYHDNFRMEHVNISGMSNQISQDFGPEVIVGIGCENRDYEKIYKALYKNGSYRVFLVDNGGS